MDQRAPQSQRQCRVRLMIRVKHPCLGKWLMRPPPLPHAAGAGASTGSHSQSESREKKPRAEETNHTFLINTVTVHCLDWKSRLRLRMFLSHLARGLASLDITPNGVSVDVVFPGVFFFFLFYSRPRLCYLRFTLPD